MKKRIAIIGAGFSGVVLGQQLKDKAKVKLFEKSRGIGGRMSTRYTDTYAFDMGAQCFTARTKQFQQFLLPYFESGHVAEWKGTAVNLEIGKPISKRTWFETHLVSKPNMNSLCKEIAKGLDISLGIEIAPLGECTARGYELIDKNGASQGFFDMVISTAPPVQTQNLFGTLLPEDNIIANSDMHGCYVLMLGFNKPWDKDWIAAKVRNNPIKWISVNSSKPGRNDKATSLLIHSRSNWAKKHIDDDLKQTEEFLIKEFEKVTGIDASQADYVSLHRWRYAIVANSLECGPYYDEQKGIAAVSDWSATSRIEEVWLTAHELANKIGL